MRSSSPFMARAVRAITGMTRVAWSCLSCTVASRPSMPGSWMSIRMRYGRSARARVRPASASVALMTSCPAAFTRYVCGVLVAVSSSTISTLAMSGHYRSPRHGPSDLGREALLIEVSLFHDRRHGAGELCAVLGSDRLAGDDQDGDARRIGV